jgi:hypothetical protein
VNAFKFDPVTLPAGTARSRARARSTSDLRQATQRLWSWRSEYGNDRYWSERLGRAVIARGADTFWSDLVGAR